MTRPTIGSQFDHDARHFQFVRSSGYRPGDFAPTPDDLQVIGARVLAVVVVLGFVVMGAGLALGWFA